MSKKFEFLTDCTTGKIIPEKKIYTDFLIYFSFERRGFAYILHKEDILNSFCTTVSCNQK